MIHSSVEEATMSELSPHAQERFNRLSAEVPIYVREAVLYWWFDTGMTGSQAMERLATVFGALVAETKGTFSDLTADEYFGFGPERERVLAEIRHFKPKEE
jgi:hypothetical protein